MSASVAPVTAPILTRRQYVDAEQRRMVAEYNISLAEVRRAYPASAAGWSAEWWANVVTAVERGVLPSTRMWRSFTAGQQRDLLRTRRALADPLFAHALVSMGAAR